MSQLRCFRNTDPPAIVKIWRNQPRQRALVELMSHGLFEELVLSKPFFEAKGLIVAEQEGCPVGFVHASFAPDDTGNSLDNRCGVICLMMVDDKAVTSTTPLEIRKQLLDQAEQYLRENNSRSVYFGSRFPDGPFYLGLYGGSQIPGILKEDTPAIEFLLSQKYREAQRIEIMQRSLPDFRSIIDRRQSGVRRSYRLQVDIDPNPQSWWEACTLGSTDRTRFWLVDRKTEQMCGNVTFWDIQPLARNWGVRAMGLYDLAIDPGSRQGGLATFLVSESLRYMQQQGISLVEAQVAESNKPAMNLFRKLGFRTVDQGIVLTKELKRGQLPVAAQRRTDPKPAT